MSNPVQKILRDALIGANPNAMLIETMSDKTVTLSICKDGVSLAWMNFNGDLLDALIANLKKAREMTR